MTHDIEMIVGLIVTAIILFSMGEVVYMIIRDGLDGARDFDL